MKKSKSVGGWCLTKTIKVKPTGCKGYTLTIYAEDDVTIVKEYRAKTVQGLWKKIDIDMKRE